MVKAGHFTFRRDTESIIELCQSCQLYLFFVKSVKTMSKMHILFQSFNFYLLFERSDKIILDDLRCLGGNHPWLLRYHFNASVPSFISDLIHYCQMMRVVVGLYRDWLKLHLITSAKSDSLPPADWLTVEIKSSYWLFDDSLVVNYYNCVGGSRSGAGAWRNRLRRKLS